MRRSINAGITQLELMVSLTILAMIIVILANTLDFNRQTINRFQDISHLSREYASRRALRSRVEGLTYASASAPRSGNLAGSSTRLEFRGFVDDGSFWAGAPVVYTLYLRYLPDTEQLVLEGKGRDPIAQALITTELIISESTENLSIKYFGKAQNSPDAIWSDTWTDARSLPDLIKIEWDTAMGTPSPPLTLVPGKIERQRYMSLSSLVPPE